MMKEDLCARVQGERPTATPKKKRLRCFFFFFFFFFSLGEEMGDFQAKQKWY
jgi:hypothetical protein